MPKRRVCTKCGKNKGDQAYVSARGRVCSTCRKQRTRFASRDVHLLETKGITLAEYELLFKLQRGRCAICHGVRPGSLDVDHDHRLEKLLLASGVAHPLSVRLSIRGLLCRRCNRRLLPAATDSVVTLTSAINYLRGNPVFTADGAVPKSRLDTAPQTGMIEGGDNEVHDGQVEGSSDIGRGVEDNRAA